MQPHPDRRVDEEPCLLQIGDETFVCLVARCFVAHAEDRGGVHGRHCVASIGKAKNPAMLAGDRQGASGEFPGRGRAQGDKSFGLTVSNSCANHQRHCSTS